MTDNQKWALIILATAGAAYLLYKRSIPQQPMSQDELEAIAPAPFSTEGGSADNLTPADLYTDNYTTAAPPNTTQPFSGFPGLFASEWNTPDNPGGRGDNYPMRNKRRPRTREIVIATWNTGHGTVSDALDVASKADATALQETGDAAGARVKKALKRAGMGIIEAPGHPGAASTPLVYNRSSLRLLKTEIILTSHAQDAGPGAGPDHVKNKWLVGGVFWHKATSRRVRIYSVHYVASSYTSIRERIAIAQSKAIAKAFQNSRIPVFIGGDFNAIPNDNVIAPLYRDGWTNDQRVGKVIDTHGNRAIDYIWFRLSKGVHFVNHYAINTHGDHDAVIAKFRL